MIKKFDISQLSDSDAFFYQLLMKYPSGKKRIDFFKNRLAKRPISEELANAFVIGEPALFDEFIYCAKLGDEAIEAAIIYDPNNFRVLQDVKQLKQFLPITIKHLKTFDTVKKVYWNMYGNESLLIQAIKKVDDAYLTEIDSKYRSEAVCRAALSLEGKENIHALHKKIIGKAAQSVPKLLWNNDFRRDVLENNPFTVLGMSTSFVMDINEGNQLEIFQLAYLFVTQVNDLMGTVDLSRDQMTTLRAKVRGIHRSLNIYLTPYRKLTEEEIDTVDQLFECSSEYLTSNRCQENWAVVKSALLVPKADKLKALMKEMVALGVDKAAIDALYKDVTQLDSDQISQRRSKHSRECNYIL